MTLRVEWRTRGEMNDTLLVLDDDQKFVSRVVEPTPTVLRDFLNDMTELEEWQEEPLVAQVQPNPESWGKLVMARATSGEVLAMDPESYWDGIYLWFRSRGNDPHAPSPRRS